MADKNLHLETLSCEPDSADAFELSTALSDPNQERLQRIGRYRIERILGRGGFGLVYLAQDEQLDRPVAIKVPHAKRISQPEDAAEYLAEARTVANLDHPGIVPVHDVGSTEECPCFVVSKYIDGTDLATRLKEQRIRYREAAELIATVAEALHYAHKQGLVHRDVKPGNIMISSDGQPFVVDFGVALREANIGKGPRYAGTPAYMSPEQARGEGHRVDGRSDVFSLGVVFYELLTGRRPFRGETRAEVLEQVTSLDARPLRQYDENLPKELERICSKAMAKRARDRYSSAHDMAEDLRVLLADETLAHREPTTAAPDLPTSESRTTPAVSTSASTPETPPNSTGLQASDSHPIEIVPKGLRSFDAHDADFFLELLPGPRDREGLPDILRFWKTRIEEADPDQTFCVGLIYGPSGCGKSSLVKAGLLPQLDADVVPVYIEATPHETEARLLHGLRKRCPALQEDLGLKETLADLRRGRGLPVGKKVLIVVDQFEQWLHATRDEQNSTLVQALRQCDGEHVQCIVMVRDDFWMAATRFMRELEIRLVEAENSAAVDLFPQRHAEKVLTAFGRAFGTLPSRLNDMTRDQKTFLQKAVAGLAEDGKVICVRLALFAEMMKGKAWSPATLKQVGGTTGIGVTFLEETFSAANAPPEHRYHQKAARAILNELLPDSGTHIRGYMRSQAELLAVSGYAHRPRDFEDLIRILDSEIRLITPTDPEGLADDDSVTPTHAGERYYQLTHDYLVHSLRDWLTRKQKESRRGRAELMLADRSAMWTVKPENRFLPSWWEHVNIRLFTTARQWTRPQRKMMRKAARVHGIGSALLVAVLVLLMAGAVSVRNAVDRQQQAIIDQKQEEQNDAEAARLVEGLLSVDPVRLEDALAKLTQFQKYTQDDLGKAYTESFEDSNAKLYAALALLPQDPTVLPFLRERLLSVTPQQFAPVRNQLAGHKADLVGNYAKIARDLDADPAQRFRATCALASYEPDSSQWEDLDLVTPIANHLVRLPPSELVPWQNALRPVKQHLVSPLSAIYRNDELGEQIRGFAADTLADYLADDPAALFDLLADADAVQFGPVFDQLDRHRPQAIALGQAEVQKEWESRASDEDKQALAMRQANAAVMLLRMDAADSVWPLLQHSADPRVRSYIIHWLSPRGADPQAILARYDQETDVTIKRALLLCLGEFSLPESVQRTMVETLLRDYAENPDAGLHAAAEWLLRRWEQEARIAEIDDRLKESAESLNAGELGRRQWYLNGQGQTFVVLDAGSFSMGSPSTEPGRADEPLHTRKIDRRFAISAKEVTRGQWRRFSRTEPGNVWSADHPRLDDYIDSEDSPMLAVRWYEAAWYCNWLSEQEGIPEKEWCYVPNSTGQYAAEMSAKPRFWDLTGYRLPTEAEWEFACRAGTETSRYYGVAPSLLPHYAWYEENSNNKSHPTAHRKPNDFGLFDMHGNANEWVYDVSRPDTSQSSPPPAVTGSGLLKGVRRGLKTAIQAASQNAAGDGGGEFDSQDAPDTHPVVDSVPRVMRGGGANDFAWHTRSAARNAEVLPSSRNHNPYGFRPVRTLPRPEEDDGNR